jgi:hypothetical protein
MTLTARLIDDVQSALDPVIGQDARDIAQKLGGRYSEPEVHHALVWLKTGDKQGRAVSVNGGWRLADMSNAGKADMTLKKRRSS